MRRNGMLTDEPGFVTPAHCFKDFELPSQPLPRPRPFSGEAAGFKPAIPARVECLEGRYIVVRMA